MNSGSVIYTFLTSEIPNDRTNVDGGQRSGGFQGFSNTYQKPPDFGDNFKISPMVYDTLCWLGLQILGEQEWEFGLCSVLEQMTGEGLLFLWDPRFQIEIRDHDCRLVWAYFPMHQHMWLARYVELKPTTRVLLEISAARVDARPTVLYERLLQHQIGHALRFLQHPTWPNNCNHAAREWKKWSK